MAIYQKIYLVVHPMLSPKISLQMALIIECFNKFEGFRESVYSPLTVASQPAFCMGDLAQFASPGA